MPVLLQLIFTSLLLVFLIIVAVVLVVHLVQEATGRAPFIPISNDVMPDILEALELSEGSVMYDLGSGDGRVVFAAASAKPHANILGVERSFLPYSIASFKRMREGAGNVRFIRGNFFDVPVGDATHIFLYLFPGLMNALLPKFEKELAPGTRVVSCDFKFKDKKPIRTIDLHRKRYDLGRKIYIYEF